MANNQNKNMIPRSGGFFEELTTRFKLISRLIMDPRVHPLTKLLPVGALAYAVWPIDVPGPIDDALVLWLGTTLFVELCPPAIVDEHLEAIRQRAEAKSGQQPPSSTPNVEGDIVDGEFFETDPNRRQ